MNFTSNSQAGQDLFVKALLMDTREPGAGGTFLDIGANHPVTLSNTYALEQVGWCGVLMDNDPNCIALLDERRNQRSAIIRADATTFDFRRMIPPFFPGVVIDYLSLDVDHATAAALEQLLKAPFRYRVATIENDFYRFGPEPRAKIRELMLGQGYDLLCADVTSQDCIFEDWWIDPAQVDRATAEFYRCSGIDGLVIVTDPEAVT